jgi:hypothetical protein
VAASIVGLSSSPAVDSIWYRTARTAGARRGGVVPESTLAGIITAIGVCITAVGGLVAAFTVFLPILRDVRSTHKIVNQQRTDMLKFQRTLIKTLVAHGIEVPEDQSLPLTDNDQHNG